MNNSVGQGVLYGKGVFTTLAVYDRGAFLWEKHWFRLVQNATKIGIDLAEFSEASTKKRLEEKIKENALIDGRARITFFDEQASELWPNEEPIDTQTSLVLMVGECRQLPRQFKLTASPFPVNSRSPLAGVKSCNYLEQILAKDEAKNRGFHEAVRTNERGYVTSGCMSNVFWLKGEKLYTPALSTGCLAGTTREFILENTECEEVEAAVGELDSTDAIYLTSAGLGILRVDEFDGRKLIGRSEALAKLKSASGL